MSHVTVYVVDHRPVDYGGETATFPSQLINT